MSRRATRLAFVLLAAGLAAGCETPQTWSPFTQELSVRAEPSQYSPAMDSTVGIGLRPVFVPPSGVTVDFHWHTDFGHFVLWNPPDYKVVPQGDDVTMTDGRLYWSYDASMALTHKPAVSITIEAVDRETGKVIATKTLHLDWEHDLARVR